MGRSIEPHSARVKYGMNHRPKISFSMSYASRKVTFPSVLWRNETLTHSLTIWFWYSVMYSLGQSDADSLWHILSDTVSLIYCLWHILTDIFSMTHSHIHALTVMFSQTHSVWNVVWYALSGMLSLIHCDTLSAVLSVWNTLSDMLWHALSDTLTHPNTIENLTRNNLWQYKETCPHSPPPIWHPQISIDNLTIGTNFLDRHIQKVFYYWGMFNNIMYHWNGVRIPKQSSCNFSVNRPFVPSASRPNNFFLLCNELIDLIRVSGIANRYKKSLIENVVEFHIP